MRGHEAAPEGILAESSGDGAIDRGRANHNCIGCAVPTDDPERVCIDCRHTDEKYGTLVTGPGRPCPDCGAS
jgi:hypothetical protein